MIGPSLVEDLGNDEFAVDVTRHAEGEIDVLIDTSTRPLCDIYDNDITGALAGDLFHIIAPLTNHRKGFIISNVDALEHTVTNRNKRVLIFYFS